MTDAATMGKRPTLRKAGRPLDSTVHDREFREADEVFQAEVKERIDAALHGVNPSEQVYVYVARKDGVRWVRISGLVKSYYRKQMVVQTFRTLSCGNVRVDVQQLLVSTLNRSGLPPQRASNTAC